MSSQVSFLTEVYSPQGGAEIDIVAVHGLSPLNNPDHAEDTWKSKSSRKMWLRDFLPHQVPKARIFLFGYNSNAALSTSTAGVQEEAGNLFSRLVRERRDAPTRPLIFICHSLGGLIVKRGLVLCRLNDRLLPLYKSTYGLVFFATPHRGGKRASEGDLVASIAKALLNNPSNNFLKALKANNYFAEILRDDFMERQEDFRVLTFYETLPMPYVGIVVDKPSAVLGCPGEREIKYAVHADHSSICKFEKEDGEDYKLVSQEIQALVEDAVKISEQVKLLQASSVPSSRVEFHKQPPAKPVFPTSRLTNRIALYYVERPDHSQRLRELMEEPEQGTAPVVLLHGLAGSGKTQLASRYAKEWLRDNSNCYWLDASSLEILKAGFVEFCNGAGLNSTSGTENSDSPTPSFIQSNVSKAIQFITTLNEKWLLVFDNFDLPEKEWYDLRSYFPEGQNGQIIVTSRNRDVEREVGGHLLHIDKMSDEESINLLLKSAGLSNGPGEEEEKELKRLIATDLLGSLPLAIAQGGAFIRQRRLGTSQGTLKRLQSYRQTFEDHQAKMLAGELGGLVRQYGRSVITSWDMSFKVVISDDPIAAELLLFLGFLHHADIPQQLFNLAHDFKTDFQTIDDIDVTGTSFLWVGKILSSNKFGQWDKSTFETSMSVLECFSLIHSFDGISYNMHPLVHSWTRVSKIGSPDDIERRGRLGVAMLSKIHKQGVDRYSAQRRLQMMQYTSHLSSCLISVQKHTALLTPLSPYKLSAVTLKRVAFVLDGELLPSELRAQKFIDRLVLLALINGAEKDGLDHISTLQCLRSVLTNLGASRYAHTVEHLTDIVPALLPIAAATDHTVETVEEELACHFLQMVFLKTLRSTEELQTKAQSVLEFLETHKEDLGTCVYLFKKAITINMWQSGFRDGDPSHVEIVDNLLRDLEENLTEDDSFYILIAKKLQAHCLGKIGKREEAVKLLRSSLAASKVSTGVSNNIVSQNIHTLSSYLIRAGEFQEVVENSAYLLGRLSKELGPFHEESLIEKRKMIEFDRMHQKMLDILGIRGSSDPDIFGVDHAGCLQLPDTVINTTLELAIAYKAFSMEYEIKPLWEGVLKQAYNEEIGEELIVLYLEAFQGTMKAAHKQAYHYYGTLFETAITRLSAAYEKHKRERGETRVKLLERLRLLWDQLILLHDSRGLSENLPSSHIAENIIKSIRTAPHASQPYMLFLVNHFLQWMIQSEQCTTSTPVTCRTLEILEELSTTHFGPWKVSCNTLRATINLLITRRLLGIQSKVIEVENEMIRCRIEEEKSGPFVFVQQIVHLRPGTLGLERLNIEYKRRQWYSATIRLCQLLYDDFYYSLGLKSQTTAFLLQFLCELYGRLLEFDMLGALLARLESDARNGDIAKKDEVINIVSVAAKWCTVTEVYESAWRLLDWLFRCFSSVTGPAWKIQILKDAQSVAEMTGRTGEIPDLVAMREWLELLCKTGNDCASIEMPPGFGEVWGENSLSAEQLGMRFQYVSQVFIRRQEGSLRRNM